MEWGERLGYQGSHNRAGSVQSGNERAAADTESVIYHLPLPVIFFGISTASKYQRKKSRSKSKIATPKDPKAFRRGSSLRCAMKVGSLELGTL
jgi:hypothetical protein